MALGDELSDQVAVINSVEPTRWKIAQARLLRRIICIFGLILADVLAFLAASALRVGAVTPSLVFYRGLLPSDGTVSLFFVLATIFIVFRFLAGDYSRRQLFWDSTGQTTTSLLLASSPCLVLLWFGDGVFSYSAVLCSWAFVIVAVPLFRHAMRWVLAKMNCWWIPTALIGEGERVCDAYNFFNTSLSLGYDVRFLVSSCRPEAIPHDPESFTQITSQNPVDIVARLGASGCSKAVFASDELLSQQANELAQRLMTYGIEVVFIPPLRQLPLLGMTMNYAFGQDLLLLHFRNNLIRLPSRVAKRAFDIIGSLTLLTFLSPLFLVFGWLIWRGDGHSAFFIQKRVGRRGMEFPCIKFRTMGADAEDILKRWKAENSPFYREYIENNFKLREDPRISRLGGWLRRTSLDELPQLLNVLLGHMSLVGPRPLIPREVSFYGSAIELYKQTRPGITGLWQISGRSETTFADRVFCDGWYVRNWSFWYDLVILVKTAGVLLHRKGAY